MNKRYDVIIIGGGLAGVFTALKLIGHDLKILMVDKTLPESKNSLGGFTSFSGAKFSLLPAGQGQIPLVGNIEQLNIRTKEVLDILNLEASMHNSEDYTYKSINKKNLRSYESILLDPNEIDDLLKMLINKLSFECEVINGTATKISKADAWMVEVESTENPEVHLKFECDTIFYAGGRSTNDILVQAGAQILDGKGLDLGVRFEFLDKSATSNLRALGPDAKIIHENCRTFCLNSPGTIYYYESSGIKIPGGVVAFKNEPKSNFAIQCRVRNKATYLPTTLNKIKTIQRELEKESQIIRTGLPFGELKSHLEYIYDPSIVYQLEKFCQLLDQRNLIDWSQQYKVHTPLLDWHWNTYAKPHSHMTSLQNIYVVGDSAGHARGLLQACLSGWIAGEEYLNAQSKTYI